MQFEHHVFSFETCRNILGVCALLVVTLCSSCSAPVETAGPGETKTHDTLSAVETTGVSVVGKTHSGIAPQILKAVRVGTQPGMDRIVFEFDDAGLPEWEVKYTERPLIRDCGSGDSVSVAGKAWLQITFRGAQAHSEAGESTSGPRRRVVNQTMVRELVRTCDFEGEVTWVAGLATANEYIPRVLVGPSRMVIDIKH